MKSLAMLVVLLSLSPLAVADQAKDVATADRLFRIGKYDDAVKLYERAYVEKDDPHLLFQIGECHRLAERPKDAARVYEQFLKTNPTGMDRANAQSHLAEARHALKRGAPVPPPAVEAPPSPPPAAPPPSYPAPVYAAPPVWAPPPSDPSLRRMQLNVDIKAARKERNKNRLLGFGSFFLISGAAIAFTGAAMAGDFPAFGGGMLAGGLLGPILGGVVMVAYGARMYREDNYRVKKLENELDVVNGEPPRHENLTPPRPKRPKVEEGDDEAPVRPAPAATKKPSAEPSRPSEANDW